MGTTNGIEVSPDGKTLYVNESKQRNIWAFDLTADGIGNKRLLKQFPDHGFDGMRCDVDGNLYVTRYGKGTVAKLSPAGKLLREIDVLGARPSNICFGGADGRTAYVHRSGAHPAGAVPRRPPRPGLAALASGVAKPGETAEGKQFRRVTRCRLTTQRAAFMGNGASRDPV